MNGMVLRASLTKNNIDFRERHMLSSEVCSSDDFLQLTLWKFDVDTIEGAT